MAVKRQSRIAQSYVQLIPLLGNDFAKELQKAINNALKSVNLDGLAEGMRDAGRQAGRDFRKGLDSGVGNDGVDLNLRDTIQEAGQAGRRAGHDMREAMDAAIGAAGPDLHTEKVIDDAGNDGKLAGQNLTQAFDQAISSATPPTLPTPAPPPAAAAAAAGQTAGQQFQQGFQQAISGLGETITGIVSGAAIAGLAKKGFDDALMMDTGNKEIVASLRINSEEEADKVGDVIRAMYDGAFAETWEDAEIAVENVLSAIPGLLQKDQAEIEKTTKKVLALQQAFEIDPNVATSTIAQMQKQGLVESFNEGADLFAVGLGDVPIALREELFENFDEYSRQFKGAGLSAQAAMRLMTDAANKYGKTGLDNFADAIKEVGIQLVNIENTEVTDKLKAIGLDHGTIAKDILKGGPAADKAIESVALGILGIEDAAERATYAIALFGGPIEELGPGQIDSVLQELVLAGDRMGDLEGQADNLAKVMRDNLKTELDSLGNTAQTTFADVFMPLLEELIPIVKDVLKWINDNKETIKEWIPPLLIIGFVLSGILTLIGLVGGISIIGGLIAGIGATAWIVTGIIAGLVAVGFGIWAWVEEWPEISKNLGIIGEGIARWWNDLWKWSFDESAKNLKAFFKFIGEGLYGALAGVFIAITFIFQAIVTAFYWIVNAVGDLINGITENLNRWFEDKGMEFEIGFRMGKFETPDIMGPMMRDINTNIPVLDTGGDVEKDGLFRLAKNGVPETVTNRGLTNRTLEKMESRLDSEKITSGGDKIEINIHQLPGQSAREVVDLVMEELAWQKGRR